MDRKNGWHKKEQVGYMVLLGDAGEIFGTGRYAHEGC
jgi:hypothetical protein